MPDKKLTDSEIVKAFEDCDLENATLYLYNTKEEKVVFIPTVEIYNLINRLQAERDAWKETAETSEKAYEEWHRVAELNAMKIIELQAENEVLKARIGVYETCNARKDEAIRGLEAENERLKKTVDIHKGIAEDWKHEAKKLQMVIDEVDDYIHPLPFETDYDKAIKQAKAEAYKKCIEKANEIIDLIVDLMFDGNVSKCQLPSCHKPSSIPCESEICIQENKEYWHSKLDNLLKELVGENGYRTFNENSCS